MTIAMTARIFIALLATALAVAGCATRLVPAPDAMLLPGRGGGAMGEAAGVRLFARTEAWSVEPGAQVSGFVYFEKVRGADRVTLHATLVNARTDERFGVVSIPFIVKK